MTTTTTAAPTRGTDDLAARIQRLEDRARHQRAGHHLRDEHRPQRLAGAGRAPDRPRPRRLLRGGAAGLGLPRDAFAGFSGSALGGFTALQHISPNHVITFDETDPDRALCTSYMFAQHYLEGAEGGDTYIMRGSYENHVVRTRDGWKIEKLVQHLSWPEGNADLPAQAAARFAAAHPQGGATGAPSQGPDA